MFRATHSSLSVTRLRTKKPISHDLFTGSHRCCSGGSFDAAIFERWQASVDRQPAARDYSRRLIYRTRSATPSITLGCRDWRGFHHKMWYANQLALRTVAQAAAESAPDGAPRSLARLPWPPRFTRTRRCALSPRRCSLHLLRWQARRCKRSTSADGSRSRRRRIC